MVRTPTAWRASWPRVGGSRLEFSMVNQGSTSVRLRAENEGSEIARFGFVLLPEFPLYALVPAMEALRIANQHAGRKIYDWQTFSINSATVNACNGMSLTVDSRI